MKPRRAAPVVGLALSGCTGWQSAMDPAGPHAGQLQALFWVFVAVCGTIWALVMLVLAAALLRRRTRSGPAAGPQAERGAKRVVTGAVVLSGVVIVGLTLASYVGARDVSADDGHPLVIRVRGYQWWWEVTYVDPTPSHSFQTANEIHVPVGRSVRLELSAADVIHSFWAPNLNGKQDLIPGRDNTITFIADRPGVFREQCAQFCGMQHAHMAMLVVAEPQAAFAAWRAAQIREAAAPDDAERAEGRQVFASHACAACHTIRGTDAAGAVGPDLTHVGGRGYIASGMLPTTRGALAAWIADPQTVKPGNNMPMVPLTSRELNAVSAYLAGLK